jgi:transcriptional regulator with XRE-family HTH domain
MTKKVSVKGRELFQAVIDRLPEYELAEVADYADVSISTLHNWLKGDVYLPHLRTLTAVADAIGFQISWKLHRHAIAA